MWLWAINKTDSNDNVKLFLLLHQTKNAVDYKGRTKSFAFNEEMLRIIIIVIIEFSSEFVTQFCKTNRQKLMRDCRVVFQSCFQLLSTQENFCTDKPTFGLNFAFSVHFIKCTNATLHFSSTIYNLDPEKTHLCWAHRIGIDMQHSPKKKTGQMYQQQIFVCKQ